MTAVTRPALLSQIAALLHSAGITSAEIAQHMAPAPAPVRAPMVVNSTPCRKPNKPRGLTPQAKRVMELADRPEGVSVVEVCAELDILEPTGHRHCQRLADELHMLTRVKLPHEQRHRFFARPEHARAYFEAGQAQEPARVALSDAERKTIATNAKKRVAAHKAKPPLGARTTAMPAPVDIKPRQVGALAAGQPIVTEATRRSIDTTKRPNSRVEAMPALPPDPRWPSFASMRPGINPDTGGPWA